MTISLLFLLTCIMVKAQNTGTITGTIVTNEGTPIEMVSISIKNNSKGDYSDENGKFAIKVAEGSYTVLFSYMGNKTQEMPVKVEAGKTVNVGNITFDLGANALNEVVVNSMITKFAQKKI